MIGTGEPLVHIHGLEPTREGTHDNVRSTGIPRLVDHMKDRFQIITYNTYRSGSGVEYATKEQGSSDVNNIASECFVLLQHLNLTRVHLFAHRQVGYAAIKVALDHPDLVKSVGLLDFEIVQSLLLKPKVQQKMAQSMQRMQMNPKYQQQMEMFRQMAEAAKSGKTTDGEAVDPEIAAQINKMMPQAFLEQFAPGTDQTDPITTAIRMVATQMLSSSYEEVASRVKQPILACIWADGQEWEGQSADLLKNWLTQTEIFTVPKKGHWYSGQNDEGLAAGLIDFYSRYPLAGSS